MKHFTTLAIIAISLLVTTGCKSTQADPAQDPPVQEAGAMPDSQQTQDALAADTPDSGIVVNQNSMIKDWTRAVTTGDLEHVRLMISEGVDVNAKNEDGYTALYIASAFMHPEIVKLLIDSGADVNLRTNDDDRPPIFAFTMGADDIEFYDEAKALSIIKMLIEAKVNVNATDRNGITPLEIVGALGYSTVAEALIAAGANVNAHDSMGVTPLMAAAEQHRLKMLEVLVKAGADVNAVPSPESKLNTALLEASYDQKEIADDCKQVSGINEAFDCSYLLEDFSPGIRLLLDAGADPNQSTPGGSTPLMYAAKSGYLDGVNALLKAGADPKVRNQHQNTVLHYAANCQAKEETCVEIAKLILKAGVDVNVQDNDGDTALIIAANYHHPLLKKLFLDAGADPKLKNKEGKSAESYE